MALPRLQLYKLINFIGAVLQRFDHPVSIREPRHSWTNDVDPFVSTSLGGYHGYRMSAMNGRDVYAFEGIRYAEPPLRFEIPQRKREFQGNVSTKGPGPECMQMYFGFQLSFTGNLPFIGSEDCLTCNVYTPMLPSNGTSPQLPVLFHVHGGGFESGTANDWGPAYLLERDMVLVNCHYRVGIFGFLTTGDAYGPGNFGLRDLRMAVDWVHEHIINFGGDPNKIILYGSSAGGAMAHLLAISEYGHQGKIAGVISGSGNAMATWAVNDPKFGLEMTRNVALQNLCPVNQGSQLLIHCLRTKNAKFLLLLQGSQHLIRPQFFGPVIESASPDAILSDTPESIYAKGRVAKIPMIFLTTGRDVDGVSFLWNSLMSKPMKIQIPQSGTLRNMLLRLMPVILQYKWKVGGREAAVSAKILNYYKGLKDTESSFELLQDHIFLLPKLRSIQLHSKIAPTYSIMYNYKSKRVGLAKRFGVPDDNLSTVHAEDELMVFNRTDFRPLTKNDADYPILQKWQDILINFAVNGKLQFKNGEETVSVEQVDPKATTYQVLDFGEAMSVRNELLQNDLTKFWNSLGINRFLSL